MSKEKKTMLVKNYLKRNDVKDYNLCFTYLRSIFDIFLKIEVQ